MVNDAVDEPSFASQDIDEFWAKQIERVSEIQLPSLRSETHNFQELPLARIKKIMKLDEEVKLQMISAEVPSLFAKAAEMFIEELTLRSWVHTEENKRKTLQKNDIAMAISKCDQFDFLIDIVPRDEIKNSGGGKGGSSGQSVGAAVPWFSVPGSVGSNHTVLSNTSNSDSAIPISGEQLINLLQLQGIPSNDTSHQQGLQTQNSQVLSLSNISNGQPGTGNQPQSVQLVPVSLSQQGHVLTSQSAQSQPIQIQLTSLPQGINGSLNRSSAPSTSSMVHVGNDGSLQNIPIQVLSGNAVHQKSPVKTLGGQNHTILLQQSPSQHIVPHQQQSQAIQVIQLGSPTHQQSSSSATQPQIYVQQTTSDGTTVLVPINNVQQITEHLDQNNRNS